MGFSLKRVAKGVVKVAKKATSPIRIGVEAPIKAVTHVAAEVGVPGAKKLNSTVTRHYRETLGDFKEQMVIGAAAGATIVAGGALSKVIQNAAAAAAPTAAPEAVASPPSSSSETSSPSPADELTFGAWLASLFS